MTCGWRKVVVVPRKAGKQSYRSGWPDVRGKVWDAVSGWSFGIRKYLQLHHCLVQKAGSFVICQFPYSFKRCVRRGKACCSQGCDPLFLRLGREL